MEEEKIETPIEETPVVEVSESEVATNEEAIVADEEESVA